MSVPWEILIAFVVLTIAFFVLAQKWPKLFKKTFWYAQFAVLLTVALCFIASEAHNRVFVDAYSRGWISALTTVGSEYKPDPKLPWLYGSFSYLIVAFWSAVIGVSLALAGLVNFLLNRDK